MSQHEMTVGPEGYLAEEAEAGVASGTYSASPDEVPESVSEASVTVISTEAQAAANAAQE